MTERKENIGTNPTIRAQVSNINQPGKEIEETRKGIGCGAIAAICLSMAAGGAAVPLGYLYFTKQAPFAPEAAASVSTQSSGGISSAGPAPTDTPENPMMPETIRSNVDLRQSLQAIKITATAQDFNFETERPELQAKAVILLPLADTSDPAAKTFKWKPVWDRITRVKQNELLVAVKVINPNIAPGDAYQLFVPEGLSYRARTVDASDPSITYFYYNCQDKKGQDALLGQIGIKDPIHPKKLMWARSFFLPNCE